MDLQPFLFWVFAGLTSACAIATVVTHNIVRSATWLLFTLAGTSGLFFLIGADLVGAIQLLVYVGGTMVLVVFGVMLTAQGPFISMRTSSAEWAVSAATGIALLALLILSFTSKAGWMPSKDEPVVKYAPHERLSDEIAKAPYTMVIGQGFAGVGVGPAHNDPNRPPHSTVDPTLNKKAIQAHEEKMQKLTTKKATTAEPPLDEKAKDEKRLEMIKAEPARADAPKTEPAKEAVIRTNYLLPFEIVSVHLLVVLIAAAYLARAKRWEGKSS